MPKLFVYGTLLKGCNNHEFLELADAKYCGHYVANGYKLYLTPIHPVPIIYKSKDKDEKVFGEIYDLEIPSYISELERGYVLKTLLTSFKHGDILFYYPNYEDMESYIECPKTTEGVYDFRSVWRDYSITKPYLNKQNRA